MESTADRYRKVAAGFTRRVEEVPPDAWDNPAPCEGWLARDVVRHLVEWMPSLFLRSAGIDPPDFPPVDDNDPLALQLLTLPIVLQQAANQKVTTDNLEAVRTEVRNHTDRLEALLAEAGSPDRKAAHAVLRDDLIPALRTMLAAASPDEWTAHRQTLSAAMNHYLQAIEADVLGD